MKIVIVLLSLLLMYLSEPAITSGGLSRIKYKLL